MLKEPIMPLELVCMVICLIAVALIAAQTGNDDHDGLATEKDYSDTILAGLSAALGSAMLMAFVAVLSRALK